MLSLLSVLQPRHLAGEGKRQRTGKAALVVMVSAFFRLLLPLLIIFIISFLGVHNTVSRSVLISRSADVEKVGMLLEPGSEC